VDEFLALMDGMPIRRVGDTLTVKPGDLPSNGSAIALMSYKF